MSDGGAGGRAIIEVALFTDDVEAAKGFYARLLAAPPEVEWPGGAIFSAGDTKVLVHERAAAMVDGPPNEDHVALSVSGLDAVWEAFGAEDCTRLVEPRDYPWGRSAYLRDPDGRLVELAQSDQFSSD